MIQITLSLPDGLLQNINNHVEKENNGRKDYNKINRSQYLENIISKELGYNQPDKIMKKLEFIKNYVNGKLQSEGCSIYEEGREIYISKKLELGNRIYYLYYQIRFTNNQMRKYILVETTSKVLRNEFRHACNIPSLKVQIARNEFTLRDHYNFIALECFNKIDINCLSDQDLENVGDSLVMMNNLKLEKYMYFDNENSKA